MTDLKDKKCVPCEGGIKPLSKEAAKKLLPQIKHWELNPSGTGISRQFQFKNFYQTMSFVNGVAWIANKENHHPDLDVGFNRCTVRYTTHAISGLSENDFICAAKINVLLDL